MRERWTEADVLALPPEEHDGFDRKSGLLSRDSNSLLDTLAKAASAFANSGGGALVLGVADDGTIDGVEPSVGRTSTKDWLEQKLPNLLEHKLASFRIHTVEPASPSLIPSGRQVVVVEIGDSPLAPHQNVRDRKYYHRVAGRSEPAPHFYLELLRQRLVNPALTAELVAITPTFKAMHEGRLLIEAQAEFLIRNVGRVAAHKWQLNARSVRCDALYVGGETTVFLHTASFPLKRPRPSSILVDPTVLPGCALATSIDVAFWFPTGSDPREAIETVICGVELTVQLATETSPGEPAVFAFSSAADRKALLHYPLS